LHTQVVLDDRKNGAKGMKVAELLIYHFFGDKTKALKAIFGRGNTGVVREIAQIFAKQSL
jgi:hypothetical protein